MAINIKSEAIKTETIKIVSPVDGAVIAERSLATQDEVNATLTAAVQAQAQWKATPISARAKLCHKVIDCLVSKRDEIAREITLQMGRPVKYTPAEVRGLEERARYMIDIAEHELADIPVEKKTGFTRFICREPLGVVFVIAPWNYPYLTAVNSIIPAIMAGNSVILKHSAQTLLCAERFYQAFEEARLSTDSPGGVFQYLHLNHGMTTEVVKHDAIAAISFTGSVAGGKAIEQAAAGLFKSVALELGGKDPAYVMADADMSDTVENLVDGAFFNSGQSCCGIERIYVHEQLYDEFVEKLVDCVNQYRLGNPMDEATTLGPMVSSKAADSVREQVKQAISMGAKACIDENNFSSSPFSNKPGTPYLAPQVLINVDHTMSVMTDETFGPVVGIMKVSSDSQAIELMNDSVYGLTASIWTSNVDKAVEIGDQLNTGTVFMNRCDYLDPALAWVGIKQSGRGCSLSKLAYQQLTRAKSFHLKTRV
ncbi:MAG: aldehyde dehydrogenase family protein [Gammaproteobacteria bacterium]|nr:MAG: aldehyde dehydrogenase family protein [Gammaproteobacteria bacterium]